MKIRMFAIALLAAAVLLGGFQQGVFAKGGGTKTTISLAASASFPNAKGKAVYKVNGSEREFQVEVENIGSLKGKTLKVIVNGVIVGTMTVNSLGEARLNLDTDNGQSVPNIVAGSTVKVKTGAGVLVASGKF